MKITNGEKIIIVSRGAYNEHYKGNGWEIVNAPPAEIDSPLDKENAGKEKNKRDLMETPLSEMTLPELKKYAKLKNIDISKVSKLEDILKTIQEAKPAGEAAGNGGEH